LGAFAIPPRTSLAREIPGKFRDTDRCPDHRFGFGRSRLNREERV